MRRSVASATALTAFVAALAALPPTATAQQPLDTAYTRQIRELTSAPRFNTELTDQLPDDPRVPSPLDVVGYVPGTIGRLSYVADINRYFRALAAASPRVRVFDAGRSDEGREMIAVAIADSAAIANLDDYRQITRRLADPRGLGEAEARSLIERGRPIYYLTGSIHSPETGSPEMLMELAYRLAVEERPIFREIRERVITVIMPVQEVDGRDRMVDIYRYGRAHGVRPPLVYWGRYTAHDNNRDGMVLSQVLTRAMLAQYNLWHPTVLHDLHESVPFLYASTGTGPYNRAIDPIQVSEWNALAHYEISELTKRGLPGVWTHDFYDGWSPNYMMFIAQMRNSVGRFYETYTSFGAECDTARVAARQTSVEWFRINPPLDGVRWCIRNNINYQQSGVILAVSYVAQNAGTFLENFWLKSRRAVERGRTGTPNLWHIPADQPRRVEAAELVNLLRMQGIEVHRAGAAFTVAGGAGAARSDGPRAGGTADREGDGDGDASAGEGVGGRAPIGAAGGGVSVAPGDYLVRMDQPYGPLAGNLLGIQTYRTTDPNPYDDTGWTFGALRNVAVHAIADTAALAQPMTLLTGDVVVRGEVTDGGGRAALLLPATTETNAILLRYRLREVRVYAAEDSFTVDSTRFAAGTWIVPLARNLERRVVAAVESLGLRAVTVAREPAVARHELDLPRIALVHSWANTQNEGWVRYAFDRLGIPYTYLSTQELRDSATLARVDVLVLPYISNDARAIVNGLPMAGPPVPWRRTAETPHLGVYDETDDVRPGIGLIGLARLEAWIRAGGVLITEGGTAAVPVQFGLAGAVNITPARQLRARGTVLRSRAADRASPILYGYADTVSVYFNQSPIFEVDTATQRGTEQRRDSSLLADQRRQRPRTVLRFHPRADSLLVSGLLDAGGELAGRPAILDVQLGRGHVVLFAIRPFWRWETQGSFAFAFNAILNWNDLATGWPPPPATPRAAREPR
jgi:hypothetical protein